MIFQIKLNNRLFILFQFDSSYGNAIVGIIRFQMIFILMGIPAVGGVYAGVVC